MADRATPAVGRDPSGRGRVSIRDDRRDQACDAHRVGEQGPATRRECAPPTSRFRSTAISRSSGPARRCGNGCGAAHTETVGYEQRRGARRKARRHPHGRRRSRHFDDRDPVRVRHARAMALVYGGSTTSIGRGGATREPNDVEGGHVEHIHKQGREDRTFASNSGGAGSGRGRTRRALATRRVDRRTAERAVGGHPHALGPCGNGGAVEPILAWDRWSLKVSSRTLPPTSVPVKSAARCSSRPSLEAIGKRASAKRPSPRTESTEPPRKIARGRGPLRVKQKKEIAPTAASARWKHWRKRRGTEVTLSMG
jgi:hypothetical protein